MISNLSSAAERYIPQPRKEDAVNPAITSEVIDSLCENLLQCGDNFSYSELNSYHTWLAGMVQPGHDNLSETRHSIEKFVSEQSSKDLAEDIGLSVGEIVGNATTRNGESLVAFAESSAGYLLVSCESAEGYEHLLNKIEQDERADELTMFTGLSFENLDDLNLDALDSGEFSLGEFDERGRGVSITKTMSAAMGVELVGNSQEQEAAFKLVWVKFDKPGRDDTQANLESSDRYQVA